MFPGAGDLGAGFLELSCRRSSRSEMLRRGGDELGIDPELVEQPPLNIAGEQLTVFILAVYIDQWTRDRLQCREGGGYPVDEGSGSVLAGVATNEAGGFVARDEHIERVERVPDLGPAGDIEFRAHVAAGCPGPDRGAARSTA